ncbi:MAG: ribbon-helix-helix protein, CopG family [Candidatus Sigynarchaeota archaeon]
MSTNISVRLKKEKIKEIDEVAEMLGLDRAVILRRIIDEGVKRERLEAALQAYEKGDTMDHAASKAGIALWDLMDEIHARGIRRPVDMALVKDMLIASFGFDEQMKKKIRDL